MGKKNNEYPISSIFLQVSKEIGVLVPEISSIEDTVGQLTRQSTRAQSLEFANLQKLDFLTQTVTELANFLKLMSEEVPNDLRASTKNAAGQIKLHDLALRLESPDNNDGANLSDSIGGNCTIFEKFSA